MIVEASDKLLLHIAINKCYKSRRTYEKKKLFVVNTKKNCLEVQNFICGLSLFARHIYFI
jgi:hypothetical protein